MKEKMIALIEDILNVPGGTITEDTVIGDVKEWGSLEHVAIIGELEEKLGIIIPLEDTWEITSVKELLEMGTR